jgi:hypothetical protein
MSAGNTFYVLWLAIYTCLNTTFHNPYSDISITVLVRGLAEPMFNPIFIR